MTTFERELRRLFDNSRFPEAKFIDRTCYIELGSKLTARIAFNNTVSCSEYDALDIDIIHKTRGKIDSNRLSFLDLWGKRKPDNPGRKDEVEPYIWISETKSGWYLFTPKQQDYDIVSGVVAQYLGIYQNVDIEHQQSDSLEMQGM